MQLNGYKVRLIDWLVIFLIGVVGFYFTTNQTNADVKEMKPRLAILEMKVTIVETKMDYIIKGIDDIRQSVKE